MNTTMMENRIRLLATFENSLDFRLASGNCVKYQIKRGDGRRHAAQPAQHHAVEQVDALADRRRR